MGDALDTGTSLHFMPRASSGKKSYFFLFVNIKLLVVKLFYTESQFRKALVPLPERQVDTGTIHLRSHCLALVTGKNLNAAH